MIYSDGNGYIAPQGWLDARAGNVPPMLPGSRDGICRLSIDVLVICLDRSTRELMPLVGWYNHLGNRWQFYGFIVGTQEYNNLVPLYFTTLPIFPITEAQALELVL